MAKLLNLLTACVTWVFHLNRTLTNDDHIKVIQQKVIGSLNTIHPLKSLLLYGCDLPQLWSLLHEWKWQKVEKFRNICIRYILNVNRRDHTAPHRDYLGLLKLFERRTQHIANIINNIWTEVAPPYLKKTLTINSNNSRSQNKLIIKKTKNQISKDFIKYKWTGSLESNSRKNTCN